MGLSLYVSGRTTKKEAQLKIEVPVCKSKFQSSEICKIKCQKGREETEILCVHLPDLQYCLYRLRQQPPKILLPRVLYSGSLRRQNMTGEVLKRESWYEAVMYQVKRMLSVGLISEQEFQENEAHFRAKYKPISGGYIVQTDLLCARRRVMNGCGKEAGCHEENQCT